MQVSLLLPAFDAGHTSTTADTTQGYLSLRTSARGCNLKPPHMMQRNGTSVTAAVLLYGNASDIERTKDPWRAECTLDPGQRGCVCGGAGGGQSAPPRGSTTPIEHYHPLMDRDYRAHHFDHVYHGERERQDGEGPTWEGVACHEEHSGLEAGKGGPVNGTGVMSAGHCEGAAQHLVCQRNACV